MAQWSRLLVGLVTVAVGACGGSSAPCTSCPDVQGTYHFVAAATPPEKSSCQSLYFSGVDADVTISQVGSKLDISAFPVEATLYDSLTVSFPRMDIKTSDGDPGFLTVSGSFRGEEGKRELSVTLSYSATLKHEYFDEDCRLSVTGKMTQIGR